jgi:hypothetical protein
MAGSAYQNIFACFPYHQASSDAAEEERCHLHICDKCAKLLSVLARQISDERPPDDTPEDAA